MSELKKLNKNVELGCYKDDGLAVSKLTSKQTETLKKKMCATFRKFGLEITIEANKKTVQFLDVEFHLETSQYRPFLKPGDTPLYVNVNSNHPPSILKNIPEAVNRRLSNLSSDEEMFRSVTPIFQEALNKAGYKFKLTYKPQKSKNRTPKHQRKRPVTWWNPPYSSNVKTSIGRQFFKLLDQHFPKNSPLHKIINRNTVKMSYRTTPNFKKIISAHNSKILKEKTPDPPCNCLDKSTCPLDGSCRASNIVYQATLTTEENPPSVETYVGLTATEFKDRHRNHKTSMNNKSYSNSTTLSAKVWELKKEKIPFNLKWKILGRAQPFSPTSGVCNLCTLEKFIILTKPQESSLNKRSEIFGACRHKEKVLLIPPRPKR